MNSNSKLGQYGENIACNYLIRNGYAILRRNFRCGRLGELDIVADKAGVLCFIEVKTRTSDKYGEPSEAVTWTKRRRIYRCAEYYLYREGLLSRMPVLSFDVVEIIIVNGMGVRLRHYKQCF